MTPNAAVSFSTPMETRAQTLAEQLGCPLDPDESQGFDFYLRCDSSGLSLKKNGTRDNPLRVDWTHTHHQRRVQAGHPREAILQAVGLRAQHPLRILDATAGLGRDAFVLFSHGAHVYLFERSPWIAALLNDGIERYFIECPEDRDRCTLYSADSRETLQNPSFKPDIVYLDPMFPDAHSAAHPKKELQYLRVFCKADDADELLTLALSVATQRVVVKRPLNAAPLLHRAPSGSIRGRTCRFDMYSPN